LTKNNANMPADHRESDPRQAANGDVMTVELKKWQKAGAWDTIGSMGKIAIVPWRTNRSSKGPLFDHNPTGI
jgi:hypothetical protein